MATQRTFTAEEAKKKFDVLPPEIKSLLYSAEMSAAIHQVGERNKLHYDQMGRLEMETTNLMLGFTDTSDYPAILEKVLPVDSTQAQTIAKDINDTLFVKIREAMKPKAADAAPKVSSPAAVSMPPMPAHVAETLPAKSVVMPSSAKAPEPAVTPTPKEGTAPAAAPTTPVASAPTMQTVPAIVKPVGMPMVQHVDDMLSKPTVSMAPVKPVDTVEIIASTKTDAPTPTAPTVSEPPKPAPVYKTDPYHEPVD